MRFALGEDTAAGWVILDGLGMSVAYFPADTREEAHAYVDYRNLIDGIRLRQLRDEAHAKVEFYATLERTQRAA